MMSVNPEFAPLVLSPTAEQTELAQRVAADPELRKEFLAQLALGHIIHNPSSARSMEVRRKAMHDLMLACGDIKPGNTKVEVNTVEAKTFNTLVVLSQAAYPSYLQSGETIQALPAETEPAIQNPSDDTD